MSSRGYGFLWNNPAVGRVDFAAKLTRWKAEATPGLDYWITAGTSPEAILRAYLDATGMPPLLPDWATGFWRCKLRYRTQTEMLDVAKEHLARSLTYRNHDTNMGLRTCTKIGLNNTCCNDRSAFDAANNGFVVPTDGTCLLGATFLYKGDASTSARMSGRIVLNGTAEIRGSRGEISGAHFSEVTVLWLQPMIALTAGDTV